MYIIAVFRSRTQTVNFKEELKKRNIRCETVSTPREVAIGCGLSVKFDKENFLFAKEIQQRMKFGAFVGFYEAENGKIIRKTF